MSLRAISLGLLALLAAGCAGKPVRPETAATWQPARVVKADVVAINQPLVYNRFGSMNPWGMVYALRGDLADGNAGPGAARLRDDRRPRPLVLRVAEGDELSITFQNLLAPVQRVDGNATCDPSADPGGAADEAGHPEPEPGTPVTSFTVPDPPNDPCTRRAGIAVVGLTPLDGTDPVATGLRQPEPGAPPVSYRFRADKAGSYFFSSLAAIAGGEGDGGALTHGLFGMVIVEPKGSRFYRSQVAQADMACARGEMASDPGCASSPGEAWLDYEARRNGKPLLNMLRANADGSFEIVHGDLTAIVVDLDAATVGQPATPTPRVGPAAWREFAIMFHDELKTVHHPDFEVLNGPVGDNPAEKARHQQMVGTRDGFGINYGASGMGTVLLANRVGKGPSRDCVDCAYEEFFLGSWANGDPALQGQYADDPSNVYHSYLGDRVKFYNVHAGPKETHVFHLHAHQWLSQPAGGLNSDGTSKPPSKGNYLDSQTIAPFQTFSYEIYYGGTGNRNLTPGDSIFHCHLYPHFAQGMWALWRVHEVLENGARRLPDVGGAWSFQDGAGWSYDQAAWAGPGTDRNTGTHGEGTPIPAIVPLPTQALPPVPTYANSPPVQMADGSTAPVMPGYPFYIAGKAGYRAPQPPRDLSEDAGLPRHVTEKPASCTNGINGCARTMPTLTQALDGGDMTFKFKKVKVSVLPQDGDPFERAAMNWHAGRPAGADPYDTTAPTNWFHTTRGVNSPASAQFLVNGLEAAAGAPFANPCPLKPGSGDHWARGLPSLATRERRYDVSAIELQLVVNQYGWHDKQARINVLDSDVADYEGRRRPADPFFFRANSGECIVFEHTNRTPGHTRKDAFQVATPTDIIGQHIHLVKFDVTSSDGSANGYNYEDGTLAYDHIEHIIAASKAPGGSAVDALSGIPLTLAAKTSGGKPVFQSSMQRWWADPLLDGESKDRTIATVFTHDHFGPSSIQQHGFYSALLIEPAGTKADGTEWVSTWKKPDGTLLTSGVGTQAIIEVPADAGDVTANLKGSRREFAMAVADFALLYDRNDKPIAPPHGDPTRPEAISVDHHDPYLFNYKNEPVPLRVGRASDSSGWSQRAGTPGNMANLFDSTVHAAFPNPNISSSSPWVQSFKSALALRHAPGDPSTEIFEAYDGDRVQVRLVQGAQEVQHNFTLHGQKWRRQAADPNSAWVSSQEIGISEHFEMDLQLQRTPIGNPARLTSDFLYHAGSVDALWNGAWGFFRSYAVPAQTLDAARASSSLPIRCRLAALDAPVATTTDPACNNRVPATSAMAAPDITGFTGLGTGNGFRAPGAAGRLFCIEAIADAVDYNGTYRLSDPNALRFVLRAAFRLTADQLDIQPTCPRAGSTLTPPGVQLITPADGERPLVLRMKAGEMAIINVTNSLPASLPRTDGNAELPPIVSAGANSLNDTIVPSSTVGLHAGLLSYIVRQSDGVRVGLNGTATPGVAGATGTSTAVWYAGSVEYDSSSGTVPVRFVPFETRRGMVATLSSMADPIRHPTAGLVGAIVVEPADADLDSAAAQASLRDGGTAARICREGGRDCWDEFVLVYQDGLNLKQDGQPVPDCHVCDDTYDSGDIALNFRTEPFWARMGLPRVDPSPDPEAGAKPVLVDLNKYTVPDGFLLPSFMPVATPTFCTAPGEQVVMHVVHPGGRARQRGLMPYGLRYDDLGMTSFGSPHSGLLGPQKAATLDFGNVPEGLWLYRDGPAYITAGGSWGYIDARADKPDGACMLGAP